MENEQKNINLLNSFLSIWNNRGKVMDRANAEETLHELIRRELLDENSHPRVRKSKYEKFFISVNRIVDSSITNDEKMELISTYTSIFHKL